MGRTFSFRDAWVIASSAKLGSRLAREIDPRAAWTVTEYLLAQAVDALNLSVWVQSGGKRRRKPKPVPRPGAEREDRFSDVEPMDVDDLKVFLARPRH